MTDPMRLWDEAEHPAKASLEAARRDAPPNGAQARAMQSLGLSTAVGLSAGKAAAALKGATSATAATGVTFGLGAKVLILTVVTGAVGAGVVASRRQIPSIARPTSPSIQLPSTRPREIAGAPVHSALSEPSSIPDPVKAPHLPNLARPQTSVPEPVPTIPDTLGSQRASLDSARAALGAGRASSALKILAQFELQYGSSQLGQEKTALHVRALLALGRRDEAAAEARAYLAKYPNGTQAENVQRLLAKAQQTAPTPSQ